MPTAGDVARAALVAVESAADLTLATQWVSERYAQLAARVRFRHLRRAAMFVIPGAISVGTASAVRGSNIVTGDATAQAAWAPELVGRWLRTRTTWYEIVEVVTAPTVSLRLAVEFADDSITGGAYRIVQRYAALAERARFTTTFTLSRFWTPMELRSLGELDVLAPGRPYLGSLTGGGVVADLGERDARHRVEVWPYSTTSEAIAYVYHEAPPALEPETLLPDSLDLYVLKEGVLVDVMRHKAAVAVEAGKLEAAAFWRNESRAQETRFDRNLYDAARSDRGADDSTFLLGHRAGFAGRRDIVTARDEIFARGARPA